MKKFFGLILQCIIILWIVFNIFSAMNKSFLGFRIYRVESGSMEPTLKVNDLIIVKTMRDYNIGDIVTFKDEGQYITHRIVEKDNDMITTKGDSNNTKDPTINKNQIVGRVIYQCKVLGILRQLMLKPYFWIIIFIISIFITLVIHARQNKGKHNG